MAAKSQKSAETILRRFLHIPLLPTKVTRSTYEVNYVKQRINETVNCENRSLKYVKSSL